MVLCMSSMILGGCIPSPKKQTEAITVEENPNMMYMLVGSYATPEEEGIKVYNFDEQNGNSQYISGIKGISNPSFLIPSADGERIYAVGEDSGKSSTANAIKFDKEQKKLTLLNSQPTDGGAPCYITLSPSEKFVLTANYMGGSITVFPLDKDGKLKSETTFSHSEFLLIFLLIFHSCHFFTSIFQYNICPVTAIPLSDTV